jgi:UDP-glucose:tetrahydrobiopterin glucosyltransferase
MRSLKLLFVSTSVGALGTGLGGGVELTLKNLAIALIQREHHITIVAPENSQLDAELTGISLIEIPGNLQITAQSQGRQTLITMPHNSVLGNMWDYARLVQQNYDVIVNFAYDWLPFYVTPFFSTPIAHLVSMGSLSEAMDQIIAQVAASHPHTIAVHSQAQAESFEPRLASVHNLQNGFDLSQYPFCETAQDFYACVGRIAPEKGLEDAVAAVEKVGSTLKVWGVIQDQDYWDNIRSRFPQANIEYQGFLPTAELAQALSQAKALIMTPKWVEAFGNVAIEALACGVPVIAYQRGGPAEIVRSGETGFLVEPDDVAALVTAMGQIGHISRSDCRQQAEAQYSLEAMADRVEHWFSQILQQSATIHT